MPRRKKRLDDLVRNQFAVKDLERAGSFSLVRDRFAVDDLHHICSALNGEEGPELQVALTRLVASWQNSGPNLIEMMRSDGGLWHDDLREMESWRAQWGPTSTGGAHLVLYPVIPADKRRAGRDGAYELTPEGAALVLFCRLTLNPEWGRLGGPCAQCDKYYVMNTVRQIKYCTRRCGSQATATSSTRERLDREHAYKLRRAQAAQWRWFTTRTHVDWKQWISKREPRITSKWLTRAVNKGELQPPPKKDEQLRKAYRSSG
jgi:hypothetical protein